MKVGVFYKNNDTINPLSRLTALISTNLKSILEKVSLIGTYIDLAQCETLYLKTNTVR